MLNPAVGYFQDGNESAIVQHKYARFIVRCFIWFSGALDWRSQFVTSNFCCTFNHNVRHMAKGTTLADEVIINKIYLIRDQKVMIDRDLAELYGVDTKVLKQAVRRNMARFPRDFMFELTRTEFNQWREENITVLTDRRGLRHAPFCFTEQGLTMLSCILNSKTAIAVNIRVIRIFTRMREMVLTHKDILLKLEQLERSAVRHDHEIKLIFDHFKRLFSPDTGPVRKIGFKRRGDPAVRIPD